MKIIFYEFIIGYQCHRQEFTTNIGKDNLYKTKSLIMQKTWIKYFLTFPMNFVQRKVRKNIMFCNFLLSCLDSDLPWRSIRKHLDWLNQHYGIYWDVCAFHNKFSLLFTGINDMSVNVSLQKVCGRGSNGKRLHWKGS